MNHHSRRAAIASLIVLGACATNSATEEPAPAPDTSVASDAGLTDDATPNDGGARDVNLDAERSLVCGKTGFCETKIPTSDIGEPLSLRAVWVASSNDVWTVSAEGFILHWDGTSWTTSYRAAHALYAVWGSATDVWAAGERGLLLHSTSASNNGAWTRVETGHTKDIRGIYGSAPDDVWFGYDGAVEHFDGSTLTSYDLGNPALRARTLFGRAGYGTYALYDVPCSPCNFGPISRTLIFELVPDQIAEVNSAADRQLGIFPTSAVVTDAPDDEHRFFVFGYQAIGKAWYFAYANFGKVALPPVPIPWVRDVSGKESRIGDINGNTYPPPPNLVSWAKSGVDVRVQSAIGVANRWDGTDLVAAPAIDMGFDFVPRQLNAIHGNDTDTWLVGDGFALKGPTK
ncbi:hypothetical protein AKJ09_04836 [Labilithrix luteola]|uniref:Uncharacterized protein n=1 Tax=Labilithrix luteola TaxID=1391654 RepID=A0A0K1PXC8_9BACT|nr:hypothetical protein [Labilithrix luteola]AKU98172.1 hypothetical protein AKJ09_04836 [Labilithrix luteola]